MPGARAPPLFDSPLDSRLATGEIFAESEGWKFLANSRSGDREREREEYPSMARSLVRKHLKARTPQQWMYLRELPPLSRILHRARVFGDKLHFRR